MNDKKRYELILASASPRRKELCELAFLNFKIQTANIREESSFLSPKDYVMDIAGQKVDAVCSNLSEQAVVIGADTVVALGEKIIEKPRSVDHAKEILCELSGKAHEVFTGVVIQHQKKAIRFFERTKVTFHAIDEETLTLYLETKDSLDKSGAYGIQNHALSFIRSLEGSYSNVVGLPIDRVIIELRSLLELEDIKNWRSYFV